MPLRVIARLDIKAPNLVKGIHLEGLRVIGAPSDHARTYFEQGVDEIHYQDIVASLYNRNGIADLVTATADQLLIPLTVGGGIRSIDDIQRMLRAGADKVCLNTAVVAHPELITEAARTFGAQCIVVAIEAIRQPQGWWEAFTDNGREHTGLNAYDWAMKAVELGAGELLLTSVDREGTFRGFDLEFINLIARKASVPVVAHGGAGSLDDIVKVARLGVDGVAVAGLLHYGRFTVGQIKAHLQNAGIEVRS